MMTMMVSMQMLMGLWMRIDDGRENGNDESTVLFIPAILRAPELVRPKTARCDGKKSV